MIDWNTIITYTFISILIIQLLSYIGGKLSSTPTSPVEMGPNMTEITSASQLNGILSSALPSQLIVMGKQTITATY